MSNYFVSSFLVHFAVLVSLFYAPATSSGEKVEVTLIDGGKVILPHKKAIKGGSVGAKDKGPKVGLPAPDSGDNGDPVDLSVYANQLKLAVDPVWYRNMQPYIQKNNKKYYTEVLILIDKRGNIKTVKVIKSSGYLEIDNVAIATLREVSVLPAPPTAIIKDGIIWEFSTGS